MNHAYFNETGKLVIEDVIGKQIIYRNFDGVPRGKYDKEGEKYFNVVLDDIDFAKQLRDDGWTVTIKEPNEEYAKPFAHMKVKVRYDNLPPIIHLIAGDSNVVLDEEAAAMLTHAEIVKADMVINPSSYINPSRTGIAAYLRSMYVEIENDPLEAKYRKRFAARDDEIPF